MALGGGTFTATDKVLPGFYNKFVSASEAPSIIGERGTVAIALPLDWGKPLSVVEVTAKDFKTNCAKIFGYPYSSDNMKGLRDLFKNASKVCVYNLRNAGTKASDDDFGEAIYPGTAGNHIRLKIEANATVEDGWDVKTYFYDELVDLQTVTEEAELVDNDYFHFYTDMSFLTAVERTFTGGANGTEESSHQNALNALQGYSFNTLCAYTTNAANVQLYLAYTETMRNDYGKNFRTVVYNQSSIATDVNEAIINVCTAAKTSTDDATITNTQAHALLYWVAGCDASAELNSSLTNKTYDGEFEVKILSTDTQAVLEQYIADGKFVFHKVGAEIRVLDDINALIVGTDTKAKEIFCVNQTIRILDQCANDNASLFNNKYLGKVQNDVMGRISYWNDLVDYYKELARIGAVAVVDPNEDIKVEAVEGNKRAVKVDVTITIINTMTQVYMTVLVQ